MLRADLHVHSTFSDGRDTVMRLLKEAIKRNLNVLSITDHDTIQGSMEAIEIVNSEHMPIKIIPGSEISTQSGHVLAYGIYKDIDPQMSIVQTCELVRSQGGLCFLAHPFDILRHGTVRISSFKVVDGVEVYNSKNPFNFLAKKFAERYGRPGIAGSDAHTAKYVGAAVTFLRNESLDSLLNASYTGKMILFSRLTSLLSRLNRRL